MKFKITLAAFMVAMIFTACKKEKNNSSDSNDQLSQSNQTAAVENYLNESVTTAVDLNDGNEDNSGVYRTDVASRVNACATVTHNAVAKTVTIDFGTTPCTGTDGKKRSGKIIITYTGVRDSSSARSIQYLNYKRDSVNMNGTLSMSGITRSGSTVSYNLQTINGAFTFAFDAGGSFVVNSFNRSYSINIGALPLNLSDNTTTITGTTFTGVNRDGKNFSVEITESIVFKGACTLAGIYYPAQGTHKISVGNFPAYTINWGSGVCDKSISVTILGQTQTITLP